MISSIPRRNINEGWLTFPDGRQVPVYTFNHHLPGTGNMPVWTQERLIALEASEGANSAKKTRWRKECELTERLLAEHGGRIRVLMVRHDNDQTPIFMGEFRQDGDVLVLVERKDKGNAGDYLLADY